MLRCVLGIEGGGTKSLMRLADMTGNTICEVNGNCLNIYIISKEKVADHIQDMFYQLRKNTTDNLDIQAICIGSSGIFGKDSKQFFHDTLRNCSGCSNIIIENDAYISLYGHLGANPGISITSGTGSICYGKNLSGTIERVGGWGNLISDEGSAYAIAKDALAAVFNYIDGKTPFTKLYDDIFLYAGVNTADDLIAYLYDKSMDKTKIAALSLLVDNAANNGDDIASSILKKAAYDLFSMGSLLAGKLGFDSTSSFKVVLNGSVLTQCKYVQDEFTAMFIRAYPLSNITLKAQDAVHGAILLALAYS